MTRTSKLANENSLIVKKALTKPCTQCNAQPGQRCVTNNVISQGRPLKNRVVHYARVELKPNP